MLINTGGSHERSKVRIWATIVVAISAPMTKAMAAVSGMLCFLTNDSMSRAAAVELCNSAVAAKPEIAEVKRFLVPREIHRRRDEPYARVKPILTIRVPHNKRQTEPMICRKMSDALIGGLL